MERVDLAVIMFISEYFIIQHLVSDFICKRHAFVFVFFMLFSLYISEFRSNDFPVRTLTIYWYNVCVLDVGHSKVRVVKLASILNLATFTF